MYLQFCTSPVFVDKQQQRWLLTKTCPARLRGALLIMKFLAFFLLAACLQVSAKGYSQQVTLSVSDVPVWKVFKEIKKQTGYDFLYTDEMLKKTDRVTLSLKNSSLQTSVDECLRGLPLEYTIVEKTVVIKRKTMPPSSSDNPIPAATISGTITDENGNPLAGATVKIKGSNKTAITNERGEFTIDARTDEKLEFSFVGYQAQEILLSGRTSVKVVLKIAAQSLEETVVVGYGSQKKVNLTGAVSSVNFETPEMTSRPLINVSTALTGLASGVYVNQNNGAPSNSGASIKIRGTGTLNQGSDALVIIDGQPGDMNIINPNDIASVSILKDASSAAIYGSRASNGVILITTKAGMNNAGKVTFDYNGYIGRTAPTKLFDLLTDVADHMELVNRIERNSSLSETYTQERIDEWRTKSKTDPILYPNTNWYDVIIRNNTISSNTFSARGGNEKINFYTSFGILDNSGLVPKSGVTRYNFRNNLNYKVTDWLKFGSIITGNFYKNGPDLTQSLFIVYPNPAILPKHPDGRYGGAMSSGIDAQAGNLLQEIEQQLGENSVQNYTAKLYGIISPVKGLDITGSYFIDANTSNSWGSSIPSDTWNFQNETKIYNSVSARTGVGNSFSKSQRQVWDFFATYNKSIGKHNIRLLAGFNQERYDRTWFSASKLDLISIDVPVLDAASNQPAAGGSIDDYRMRSYFGRIGYDFANKYLFEANLRYDGSSRFSPENRWGTFPSFSAGWIASKEGFWDPLVSTIDYFKLRASWGKLGNNGIGNYAWQSVYGVANYSFNDRIVQGLAPTALTNSNIKWETTDVLNIGADFELFNAFNITVDYYDKFSHGILAQLPIPYVNGTLDPPYTNAAEVRNKGIELDIRYHTKIGRLGISIGALGAYNKNRIEKYKGEIIDNVGPNVGSWTEGHPIGIFNVREVDHIVQDQAEIDGLIAKGYTFDGAVPGPGDFLYKDANGDKVFNGDDMVLKGNPIPLYTYAFNMSVSYAGFDFYALANGVGKVDKYLRGYAEGLTAVVGAYGYPKRWLDSWTPENKSTTIPKLYSNDSRNNGDNDYFMSPGDYFRIKTLQLGYTLPKALINRIKLNKVRIYVNLENYFQFTKYRGMDPEADPSVGLGSGNNETNTYPLFKTASVGLNIGF